MAGDHPDWTTCDHDGCIGSRVANTTWCLTHVAEKAPDALDTELRRIGAEGSVDARGVPISAELLQRILTAAPREDDRRAFTAARFDQATFEGVAVFDGVTFEGEARFDGVTFQREAGFAEATFLRRAVFAGATFQGEAWFDGATFQRMARFDAATFEGEAGFAEVRFQGVAVFAGATFQRRAVFAGATLEGEAGFAEATFQRVARFAGVTFQSEAGFDGVTFEGAAGFAEATFQGRAVFAGVTFEGVAWFTGATFQRVAWFTGATFQGTAGFAEAVFEGVAGFARVTFEHAPQVGPLLARQLVLDGAVFGERAQLEVTAAAVCARRAQFPAGVHLRLRFASVVLDDANLAAPAIVAGAPFPFLELEAQEQQVVHGWERLPPGPRAQRWRPRLLSVSRADVAGLRLADVDLRACRFTGAHNLDRLRLEGAPLFARTAGWWRARRKTLAEEQYWRAHRPGRWWAAGWYPQVCQPPASPKAEASEVLEPARLAALYRDLRKGREDAKDEPGAADFYYGECELRRHDRGTPRAERLVLWLYWLLSGYGLRAWRALAALAVVVVLAGIILAFWGFPSAAPSFRPAAVDRGGALVYKQEPADPPGLGRLPEAVRFSARSATALLRGPDRPLTPLGEWLEIGLRFTGPVLLGLALLSVRGRVRR
jgi:uncharacterized protein YjbI with pentapeptide repeats